MNDDPLYSVEEAAKYYGRGGPKKWTIQAWLSQGRLQRTKVGSRTMIRQSQLEKMIVEGGKSQAPNKAKARKGR